MPLIPTNSRFLTFAFTLSETSPRLCCSLLALDDKEAETEVEKSSKDPDVTILSKANGHCQRQRNSGRLPPPMRLKKCVLIDSQCSLHKYQAPNSAYYNSHR